MLLFRAWWRRGEKERRGVEVVSSCILLVLPPYKTNAVVLRVLSSRCLGQVGIWLCSRAGWPPLPCAPWKCGLGPSGPSEMPRELSPPRLTLVSQASRREFLLHCALVVLGNADLKPSGSGSAVGEEIPALAPRWPRCWRGLSWRWAASSFLPGLWLEYYVGFHFPPVVWQGRVRLQREQVKRDYKVPVEFFKVFRVFF